MKKTTAYEVYNKNYAKKLQNKHVPADFGVKEFPPFRKPFQTEKKAAPFS